MAVREIVTVGAPVLRQKAKKVTSFGETTEKLVQDMLDSMRAANGLGLAAPQIGVPLRVIVVEMPENDEKPRGGERYVLCNPKIVRSSKDLEEGEEGCLSVPGMIGEVVRATAVTVKGATPRGKRVRHKARGLLARAFQHEIDHLNGVLFLDRVESSEKLHRVVPPEEGEEGEGKRDAALTW
ncbi:MAG: peptide deformylase [Chloroflexota bacterium]